MENRKENLKRVQEKIYQAAKRAGRNPDEITLLAVSKVFTPKDIEEVYQIGQRDFGESRAQELRDKKPVLANDINWHFIGPLQSNKIKYVVPDAKLIHAVDSVKLAHSIAEYGLKKEEVPSILIEINTSREEAKHGFVMSEAVENCLEIAEINNLKVCGLMTMAPYTGDEKLIRTVFSSLKKLQQRLKQQTSGNSFDTLSMGMSGDFEIAIEEGSTIVRIGTAIFGERKKF